MSNIVLQASGVSKSFQEGAHSLNILCGVDFSVMAGECVAIVGSSGAGKTTLLNVLGGLDSVSSGSVFLAGENITEASEVQRDRLRNHHLGFVYQLHHLLTEFSALENVAMPLLIRGLTRVEAFEKARAMLSKVNLAHREDHKPAKLSGGERQRVAIARALVGEPDCVLMDEPTGNLDPHNASLIWLLMTELMQQRKTAFVVVTHDESLAIKMDRVLRLTDGVLMSSAEQMQSEATIAHV